MCTTKFSSYVLWSSNFSVLFFGYLLHLLSHLSVFFSSVPPLSFCFTLPHLLTCPPPPPLYLFMQPGHGKELSVIRNIFKRKTKQPILFKQSSFHPPKKTLEKKIDKRSFRKKKKKRFFKTNFNDHLLSVFLFI